MTMLATVVRDDFVLSIADRCGSVYSNKKIEIVDTRLNKHVFFSLGSARGAITFTGCAKWVRSSGKSITTDRLVADVIAECAAKGAKLGDVFEQVAGALNAECEWLEKRFKAKPPLFTLHLAGFTDFFREPWLAMITDSNLAPDWSGRNEGYVRPGVGRFTLHFGVAGQPNILWGGDLTHLTSEVKKRMQQIVSAKSARPYDVANFAASTMRKISRVAPNVGSRVSAIVAPSHGTLDTGLWVNAGEPTLGVLPWMIFPNGTKWEPNELPLGLADFVPGRLDSFNLMYRTVIRDRIPARMRRRLDRFRSEAKTPTITEMFAFVLFGKHWDDGWQSQPRA